MAPRRTTRQASWKNWVAVMWVLTMSMVYLLQMHRAVWHEHGDRLRELIQTIQEHLRS